MIESRTKSYDTISSTINLTLYSSSSKSTILNGLRNVKPRNSSCEEKNPSLRTIFNSKLCLPPSRKCSLSLLIHLSLPMINHCANSHWENSFKTRVALVLLSKRPQRSINKSVGCPAQRSPLIVISIRGTSKTNCLYVSYTWPFFKSLCSSAPLSSPLLSPSSPRVSFPFILAACFLTRGILSRLHPSAPVPASARSPKCTSQTSISLTSVASTTCHPP
mmetsp:Transcript_3778/g.5491  ORF Transcript_3778/g.5491 Transcript_3778/m.5491 type:complete len:219 (+) Transcript_3778:59-715(+)